MPIFVSPWEWYVETTPDFETGELATSREWRGPGGGCNAIDLRNATQRVPGPITDGVGVFIYDTMQTIPGAEYLGDDPNARMTRARRNALADMVGVRRNSLPDASLAVILAEFILGSLADPTGQARQKPLRTAGRQGAVLHMRQYGKVWSERFSRASQTFAQTLAVRKVDYVRNRALVDAGLMSLGALRRWNGANMLEYWGRTGDDLLIQLVPDANLLDGWRRPASTFGDTFVEATTDTNLESHTPTGASAGTGWTNEGGSAGDIIADEGIDQASRLAGAPTFYRMDDELSTDTHSAQAILSHRVNGNWTTRFTAIVCRMAAAARTGYLAGYDTASDDVQNYRIYEMTTGTFSQLSTVSGGTDAKNGNTNKLSVAASSQEQFALDGTTSVNTSSDTTITNNLRCGISGNHGGTDRCRWNTWTIVDDAAAAGIELFRRKIEGE